MKIDKDVHHSVFSGTLHSNEYVDHYNCRIDRLTKCNLSSIILNPSIAVVTNATHFRRARSADQLLWVRGEIEN